MELVQKREFSDEKRKELADKGHALPDGSFPIENITDLHNAIQSIGRAKNYSKVRSHIISRAKALGATSILPDDWKVEKFIGEVKDAFEKAIGTSSSVDQERDERTVENYVRQSGNVNTNPVNVGDYTIGGNLMSNQTTEPDPTGDIAVQKDLPNATRPDAVTTIAQETRPTDGVSPSEAPNNDALADVSSNGAGVYKAGMVCPDCNQAVAHKCAVDKADESAEDSKVEKSAAEDEITESPADDEAVEKSVDAPVAPETEIKKSVWGGAFAPVTPKF